MTAVPIQAPPFREVFNRDDVEDVARKLQKARFGAFLSAKHILLERLQAGVATAVELAEKYHCGPALRLAGRVCGWFLGGLGLLARATRTAGVLPAAVWFLTTPIGGAALAKVGSVVSSILKTAGTALARAGSWLAGLFGSRGEQVKAKIQAKALKVCMWTETRVAVARVVADSLLPSGLVRGIVRGICRERVIRAVLNRVLSPKWGLPVRVFLNVVLMPVGLAASLFVPQFASRRSADETVSTTWAARSASAADEEAAEPPLAVVPPLPDADQAEVLSPTGTDGPVPPAPRPNAGRSPHAKKRR